jgi:hypothetical protein
MVRLRLQRMGVRNNPFYRIVAADARSPRDGKHLELLGSWPGPCAALCAAPARRPPLACSQSPLSDAALSPQLPVAVPAPCVPPGRLCARIAHALPEHAAAAAPRVLTARPLLVDNAQLSPGGVTCGATGGAILHAGRSPEAGLVRGSHDAPRPA